MYLECIVRFGWPGGHSLLFVPCLKRLYKKMTLKQCFSSQHWRAITSQPFGVNMALALVIWDLETCPPSFDSKPVQCTMHHGSRGTTWDQLNDKTNHQSIQKVFLYPGLVCCKRLEVSVSIGILSTLASMISFRPLPDDLNLIWKKKLIFI